MRTILHILTRPEDELIHELIERQKLLPHLKIEVVDLTTPAPHYEALVERIFLADSVAVS